MSILSTNETRRRRKAPSTNDLSDGSNSETTGEVEVTRNDSSLPSRQKHEEKKSSSKSKVVSEVVAGYQYRWIVFALLTAMALYTRLRNLAVPDYVTWDEAHFGKFASNYIKRDFFFDLHPPGGKIMLAIPGLFAGYNGSFGFESGVTYPDHVPYVLMRGFTGFMGAMVVPVVYQLMLAYGCSVWTSAFASFMILFDMIFITITRYVLLDSPLLIFTALSLLAFMKYRREDRKRPFSFSWWCWMSATGFFLGMVVSVKWIGCFVVALVGIQMIVDLWLMLGDTRVPLTRLVKSFCARAFCLIAIPLAIYMFWIHMHFVILQNAGSGAATMSTLFQLRLRGQEFDQRPLQVAYGSIITLKNNGYNGGLLHSHQHTYPEGSKQQQITAYHFNDDNNKWVMRKIGSEESVNTTYAEGDIEYVKEGDVIRLVHLPTKCYLHSHQVAAPLTNAANEVSCYGRHAPDGFGDENDHWEVIFDHDLLQKKGSPRTMQALTSYMILKHVRTGCYLRSHNRNLPEWGFKQNEVICDKVRRTDKNNLWNVEYNENNRLPPAETLSKSLKRISFVQNFIELNVAMWRSNKGLSPDPNKVDDLASVPSDWPWARRGIRMTSWDETKHRVWMMGNPIVWWSGFVAIIGYFLLLPFFIVRRHRQIYDLSPEQWTKFVDLGMIFVLGWALHYLPFFLVGRVMYLHHYIPAAMFLPMVLAAFLDFCFDVLPRNKVSKYMKYIIMVGFSAVVLGTFWIFRYIPYGMHYPVSQMAKYRWRQSWNIV